MVYARFDSGLFCACDIDVTGSIPPDRGSGGDASGPAVDGQLSVCDMVVTGSATKSSKPRSQI